MGIRARTDHRYDRLMSRAIETASEQPLVFYHNVVMEVVRTLSRHLPRYEASVQSADSVADCVVRLVHQSRNHFSFRLLIVRS